MMRCRVEMLVVALLLGCPSDDAGEDPTTDTGASTDATDESSGASESSTGELPEVDYEIDIQPILNANCTCHLQGASGTMTAPFMTLNPGMSHAQIVGVASEQSALVRVAPSDLEASYLWHKLSDSHTTVGGMGTSMPPTVPLMPDDLELVRVWILRGAEP